MGHGAGEAEKKAKELVERMVRLANKWINKIIEKEDRYSNKNSVATLRRTNLTASEVTKLLAAYSTTMVPLILTFPSQIFLFIT